MITKAAGFGYVGGLNQDEVPERSCNIDASFSSMDTARYVNLEGGKQMRVKVLIMLAVILLAMASIAPASAHVHPIVPADECGLGDGAGNNAQPANGDHGDPAVPGFAPNVDPRGPAGSGVDTAKDNCKNFVPDP